MSGGFISTSIEKVMSWARAQSLWYVETGSSCCADEILETIGCRYDLERFGCLPQSDAGQADLLIITGMISMKAAPYLKELYDSMHDPKYVLAIGSCANSGGAFAPEYSYSTVPGANQIVPVDVYVPGCPPRPEAIMNGLITLQDKIREHARPSTKT